MVAEETDAVNFDSREFLANLSRRPGVYRMLDARATVIYVGKAKNLKNRVSSYFRENSQTPKTRAMVKQIADIQITITNTEGEALLLENNLIKSLKPRYNILLKDDKSYPYIFLSTEDEYPRLAKHRGARKQTGRYFGPYPSASSVNHSLHLLQKVFPIRQCEDSVFKNRSRACLQYQIKRCSGPCVGLADKQQYQLDTENIILFLEGKSALLIERLVAKMETASEQWDFEQAAIYRDQIINLRRIQEKQYISTEKGDFDIIAIDMQAGKACIQIFYIRDGLNLGNKSFFPKCNADDLIDEVLNAFVMQYYLNSLHTHRPIPQNIIINHSIADLTLLQSVLRDKKSSKIRIKARARGEQRKWLNLASENASIALQTRLNKEQQTALQFAELSKVLNMCEIPQLIECFDISHHSGEATVASCVVFDQNGANKEQYRRFNIKGITAGDDYAAMQQAIQRRYLAHKERGQFPELLLIDGGKGQVNIALEVLQEYPQSQTRIIGITKGEGRKAEFDTLYFPQAGDHLLPINSAKVILADNSPAMHLIQQLRDEAHRFAITGHRKQRAKARKTSELENIEGLGAKRRQLLLKQFGGVEAIKRSSIDNLVSIKGISLRLAENIYHYFHS